MTTTSIQQGCRGRAVIISGARHYSPSMLFSPFRSLILQGIWLTSPWFQGLQMCCQSRYSTGDHVNADFSACNFGIATFNTRRNEDIASNWGWV